LRFRLDECAYMVEDVIDSWWFRFESPIGADLPFGRNRFRQGIFGPTIGGRQDWRGGMALLFAFLV